MPFIEGSIGCHAHFGLYAQSLNAKERHVMLPLMIASLLCSPSLLLLCHHKFVQTLIFPYTKGSNTFRSNFY